MGFYTSQRFYPMPSFSNKIASFNGNTDVIYYQIEIEDIQFEGTELIYDVQINYTKLLVTHRYVNQVTRDASLRV